MTDDNIFIGFQMQETQQIPQDENLQLLGEEGLRAGGVVPPMKLGYVGIIWIRLLFDALNGIKSMIQMIRYKPGSLLV